MPHLAFTSLILILLSFFSQAEESTRIVVLQVPVKEAASMRLELNDASKGARAEAVDALLKRRGIKELARFDETNPWRNDDFDLKLPKDAELIDLSKPSVFVSMQLSGTRPGNHHTEMLSTHIDLPISAKKLQLFENLSNAVSPLSGRWQERVSWGDDKVVVMVWQYSVVTRAPYVPEPGDPFREYFKVEMKWYRATKEDLKILESAKAESREKASLWVAKRAKLHKEGMFRLCASSSQETAIWGYSDAKIVGSDDDLAVEQDGFWVMTQCKQRGDLRSVEFEFKATSPESKGGDEFTQKKESSMTLGAWDFHVIEEMQGANVVLFRFSNDS